MKIIVTGANGFVGQALKKKLLKNNDNKILAVYYSKNKKRLVNKNLKWKKIDLSKEINKKSKDEIIKFNPEIAFHFSWFKIPDFSLKTSIQNLIGSINICELILKIKSCKKIVVSGSCFEDYSKKNKKNNDKLRYFVWAKNSLREFLFKESSVSKKKIIWLKYFFLYGHGQKPGSLIPSLINSLKNNKKINIKTPFNKNDFIHIDDAIEITLRILNNSKDNQIIDIGSGKLIPVWKVLKTIEISLFKKPKLYKKLLLNKKKIQKTFIKAKINNTNKIIKNYKQMSFQQGINKTVGNS